MTIGLKSFIKRSLQVAVGAAMILPAALIEAVELKDNAPVTYTVKKNDTLWDIASLFLDQPWLWPELWRNNTQIENPHLIYPGDVLTIRFVDGEPVLEVQRDKTFLTISPDMVRTVKPSPIGVLPWSTLATYISQNEIVEQQDYDLLPYLLGNQSGGIRFVSDDLVLSRSFGRPDDQYRVVRKQFTIKNLDGEVVGIQINHIADAEIVEDEAASQWLVKVSDSNLEAQRGDRLYSGEFTGAQDMTLQPATDQKGHVIGNLHQHELLGKGDVVIVDLGSDALEPGTVMGIYAQGPDIIDGERPQYASEASAVRSVFNDGSKVSQPALKIGELIIFKTFDKASYGIISRSRDLVKTGAIVAKP
ncbi:LysM domain-containing protein [Alteromonas aestuariivivens]|uniref:LysM domain-containing protein n=1 Tax=Alteromonas aestuariivivens TaxID=1938339 RepID=A0A3D8M5D7_9ALTE|nr:LysM domain-containing protein [Alteromonas aestuariivivens]RDV24754.1 LysM domain-containing protein [Alteromonas aestuariivivens]